MSQPRDGHRDDLFRPSLERSSTFAIRWCVWRRRSIGISWRDPFSPVCRLGPGRPPFPDTIGSRTFVLKHMHNLSDDTLCDRWVENPYFQNFCGEVVFRHDLQFDRSSLTRCVRRCESAAGILRR
jgi:IS5 family transposase